jgi:hypothetical protein
MNYQDFKRKQILLDLQKNILSISNFNKLAIDSLKTFGSQIDASYSIDDNKSPITNIQKELEDLQNNINNKILINLNNELKK